MGLALGAPPLLTSEAFSWAAHAALLSSFLMVLRICVGLKPYTASPSTPENMMGKKAKGLRHQQKMMEKRKAKALRKTAYEQMATGENRKRKRARGADRSVGNHASGPCGNIGCARCAPTEYNFIVGPDGKLWTRPGVRQHADGAKRDWR